MTTNERIYKWLGWETFWLSGSLHHGPQWNAELCPDFQHSDSEAIKLLPTLGDKGYIWSLYGGKRGRNLCKIYSTDTDITCIAKEQGNTISEAICAAVEMAIDKEEGK